jgi:hypothetical protein
VGVSQSVSSLRTCTTHILVDLVEGSDGLDDVVVLLVDAELHLGTRVGVTETKDGAVDIAGLELLDELARVLAQTTEKVRDDLRGFAGLAGEVGEGGLDASSQVLLADTESDGLLLSGLGEVGLEGRAQEVGEDALGDVVDLLQRILGTLEWRKADELDSLSKLVEVLHGLLDFGQAVANGVGLQNYFENLCSALAVNSSAQRSARAHTA